MNENQSGASIVIFGAVFTVAHKSHGLDPVVVLAIPVSKGHLAAFQL